MRDPLVASPDLDELPAYDAVAVPIGRTFGVLAEADSGLVRYFDVALEGRARHVLIPVGHARLEKNRGRLRLRLRATIAEQLDAIPSYEPHSAWHDDALQDELLTAFGRLFSGERYYAHPAYDHSGLYAGAHPLLRNRLSAGTHGLQRLSKTPSFRIADDAPVLRGREIIGENGVRVGVVSDLIVDADDNEVRYAVVQRNGDGRETAIPIGYLEPGDPALHLALDNVDMLALPVLSHETLERSQEAHLRAVLDSLLSGSRRYHRPDFRSTL